MRSIYVILIVLLSSNANAQMREAHLKTLLSICETAQSNNDLGTVKNIANQIKNEPLHSDQVLASKMKNCLSAAFGVETVKVDSEGLVKSILEKMAAIESDCKLLLENAPNIALDNKICRRIFLSDN
jgi:hypothetical protein